MADFVVHSPFDAEKYLGDYSNLTLPEYILERTTKATQDGKPPMIIDAVTEESYKYSDFDDLTRRIGAWFAWRGMRKGETVIYLSSDMIHIPALFCGIWRANGTVRVSFPDKDTAMLLERVQESKARWILCDQDYAESCLDIKSKISWKLEVVVVGGAEGCTPLSEIIRNRGTVLPAVEITPQDIALILTTSTGTTGKSKEVAHSHASLIAILESLKYIPFTSEKPNLTLTRPTHIFGALFPFSCFCTEKPILVISKITNENVFRAVNKYKPGCMFGLSLFLTQLVNDAEASKYDFSSLEIVLSEGTLVTPEIETALMRFPNMKAVISLYGSTETMPICLNINLDNAEIAKIPNTPAGSIGPPFAGVTLKIRDPDTGATLGPNQQGEICVKTKTLFHSYYKDPEATQQAFEDGWFLTGDTGLYDENGFVFLIDRIK